MLAESELMAAEAPKEIRCSILCQALKLLTAYFRGQLIECERVAGPAPCIGAELLSLAKPRRIHGLSAYNYCSSDEILLIISKPGSSVE